MRCCVCLIVIWLRWQQGIGQSFAGLRFCVGQFYGWACATVVSADLGACATASSGCSASLPSPGMWEHCCRQLGFFDAFALEIAFSICIPACGQVTDSVGNITSTPCGPYPHGTSLSLSIRWDLDETAERYSDQLRGQINRTAEATAAMLSHRSRGQMR